jgi:hypothetical protein
MNHIKLVVKTKNQFLKRMLIHSTQFVEDSSTNLLSRSWPIIEIETTVTYFPSSINGSRKEKIGSNA